MYLPLGVVVVVLFRSSDGVHTARAVGILLLPLHIVTGQSLLGTNTTGETHRYINTHYGSQV